MQLGGGLFRQREVHVQARQLGQGHHAVAGADVLAQVDLADPQHAGERRADGLLVDHRLDPGDLATDLIVVGLGLVQLRLGRGQQQHLARALQGQLGVLGLGLELGQVALLRAVVELEQHLVGADGLAGGEIEFDDASADFRRYLHLLHRGQGADAGQHHRHRPRLHIGHGHRGSWRRGRCRCAGVADAVWRPDHEGCRQCRDGAA
ncbi:hypothetical protein D3C80_1016100 [compost metagenome]